MKLHIAGNVKPLLEIYQITGPKFLFTVRIFHPERILCHLRITTPSFNF